MMILNEGTGFSEPKEQACAQGLAYEKLRGNHDAEAGANQATRVWGDASPPLELIDMRNHADAVLNLWGLVGPVLDQHSEHSLKGCLKNGATHS
eukprot:3622459-Amphidinium_carterae.1